MKATGIVRRIDELGRIVIPKEIRRTLRLREGDPVEIYTGENGEIVLRKHSVMSLHYNLQTALQKPQVIQLVLLTEIP